MTNRSPARHAQARAKAEAAGAQRSATWAAFSISVLAAAAVFGAGYEPFRNALEDRYGLSIFVRMTEDNTFVRPAIQPPPPVSLLLLDNSVKKFSAALDNHEFNLAAIRRSL